MVGLSIAAVKDLTPLLQTLLWVTLVCAAALILRRELRVLRDVFAQRALAGAPIELGPFKLGELRAELATVRSQLDDVSKKVAQLFLITMSPAMFDNLQKLASDHFGAFEMSRGLEREPYHLRDIGYIKVVSITGIPERGADLSERVQVTAAGRAFVELRNEHRQPTP